MTIRDLTGQRFGRFVAIACVGSAIGGKLWEFQCDCGTRKTILGTYVSQGKILSCGCLLKSTMKALRTTHGKTNSRAFRTWSRMKTRCLNPGQDGYKYYGARGIKICDEWMKFENFYRDMGDPQPNHSIDRIDVNGPYSPENCRWATMKEQARNRRNTRMVTLGGIERPLIEVCEELGLNPDTVFGRVYRRGWSVERAISKPLVTSADPVCRRQAKENSNAPK